MNDQNPSFIPDKFSCLIGGYFGPSYSLEIDENGCLIYKTLGKEYRVRKIKQICPDTKRWNDFLAACDQINIWGWSNRYENPEVLDGYSWKVEIAYSENSVASRKSN